MPSVAIIGAGFTGTLIAAHLLRESSAPLRIALIDTPARFARGVAYGTSCGAHVLNVPAGRMSAFPDDPDHFLRWASARDPSVAGGSFVPRVLYGEYLGWLLTDAERAARGSRLDRVMARAVAVGPSPSGAAVVLDDGTRLEASRIAAAIGNFAPADPACAPPEFLRSPAYIRDPWSGGGLSSVGPGEPVLLLGTGLTMLDAALELNARGHRGPIIALSRRGLLPQPHRSPAVPHHPEPPADLDRWPRTALGLLKSLRREVRAAARQGIDWREVVTALRDDTPRLWASLGGGEQRRFLERLRPFWDTHRHRAAPQAGRAIDALIAGGLLRVIAGRIVALRAHDGGAEATIRRRGDGDICTLQVARVINCTGPDTDLSRCADPLIVNLRDAGLIRPDPLGLGLLTTESGASIGRAGPVPWLTIAGPTRRAQLWENTAVPELRVEAQAAARRIIAELAAATASAAKSGAARP